APATSSPPVPAGLALAAGSADPRPVPAVATALGPRTLAGYSRTLGAIGTASESLMLCLHVKTYPQKPNPLPHKPTVKPEMSGEALSHDDKRWTMRPSSIVYRLRKERRVWNTPSSNWG